MNNPRQSSTFAVLLLPILLLAGVVVYLQIPAANLPHHEDMPRDMAEDWRTETVSPAPTQKVAANSLSNFASDVHATPQLEPGDSLAAAIPESDINPLAEPTTALNTTRSAAFDPAQTSWEAPFDAAFWESTGWQFEPDGMVSTVPASAATFRRAYRRMMLECQIEPLELNSEPLTLRFKCHQTNAVMTLIIDGTRFVVTNDTRNPPLIIKDAVVSVSAAPGQPGRLKLAATGNRMIVTWNGGVALTCNQIACQSGHEIRFEFGASRTPWRIRELRIEGE